MIEGDLNIGIYVQNSINNSINCNDVNGATEAIGIYQNSQGQTITGNEMINSDLDLTIRSVIGLQRYHGNAFEGGAARAIGLEGPEIFNSRFLVNDFFANHLPTNPIPANGWFDDNPNEFNHETCSGEAGTLTMSPFWQDKNAICTAYLLSLADPTSERNFIFQLLNYQQANNSFTLPECINLVNYTLEKDLFIVWDNLLKIAQPTIDITIREEINNLQQEYVEEGTIAQAENIRETIAEKLITFQASFNADKINRRDAIQTVNNSLVNLTPDSEQLIQWKNILMDYTTILNSDPLSEIEIDWNSYASLCSDRNGPLVHLARIMANQSDATYFDDFDDCISANLYEDNNSNDNLSKTISLFQITPNPSDGRLQIEFGVVQTGTLSVLDIYGKIIYRNEIKEKDRLQLSLDATPGIYFVQMKNINGTIENRKIIIAK